MEHQVIVSALLNDATVIDDGDAVRIPHRVQSMGYNDGGHFLIGLITTGFKEMIQSLLYNPLAFTVQSAVDAQIKNEMIERKECKLLKDGNDLLQKIECILCSS